jgi:hypothetical protein
MAGPIGEAIVLESRGAGEGGWGREGDHREGGSGVEDEVLMLHNLDLCRSASMEVAAMVWRQWCSVEGGGGVEGGAEGGRKN